MFDDIAHLNNANGVSCAASTPSSSRSRRLAETFQDLRSVLNQQPTSDPTTASRSVGRTVVDARSLAVKPDGAPLIKYNSDMGGGSEFRGRGDGAGLRGGSRFGPAQRGRGTMMRGRGRGGRGGGRGGARGGRGRSKGGRGGSESSNSAEKFEHTDAEKEYLKMKRIEDAGSRVPFEPSEITVDSLRVEGPLPAVAVGEVGMTEVVAETLRVLADRRAGSYEKIADLARKLHKGEFVRFDSDEEKDAVLLRAQRSSEVEAARLSERKGEVVEPKDASFETLSEDDRAALLGKLLQGYYKGPGEGQREGGVLGEIKRATAKNETYVDRNTSSFVSKVSRMLPAQTVRGAARAGAPAR